MILGSMLSSLLFLVVYEPGPAWETGKPTSAQDLAEHGRYILQLHVDGRLDRAGGFVDADGGAAVLRVSSREQALAIVAEDPAVRDGLMVATVSQWRPVDWEAVHQRRMAREAGDKAAPAKP